MKPWPEFYWVREGARWGVAEKVGDKWFVPGAPEPFRAEMFDEIGQRVFRVDPTFKGGLVLSRDAVQAGIEARDNALHQESNDQLSAIACGIEAAVEVMRGQIDPDLIARARDQIGLGRATGADGGRLKPSNIYVIASELVAQLLGETDREE